MRNDPREGWRCAANHDSSGRRGCWYRTQDGVLEVSAGREGDDYILMMPLNTPQAVALQGILDTLAWVYEDMRDGASTGCDCTECVHEDFETQGEYLARLSHQ